MTCEAKFFAWKVNGFKTIYVRNRTHGILPASNQDDTFPFWISISESEQDFP